MPVDQNKLQSPLRGLRKLLKKFPSQASPEQVHKLRTHSRRVEAIMHALSLDQDPDARPMLDAISAIRKKAGKVRDMDVLTSYAATLHDHAEEECLIQLLEHLGSERLRLSQKLINTIDRKAGRARRGLKDYSETIGRRFGAGEKESASTQETMAVVLQMSAEVSAWPKLNRGNLHAFRLKIKELRCVLQLAEKPDVQFIDFLGQVKDAIGEWHDWNQLAVLSADILGQSRLKLVQRIREIAATKFQSALRLANRLRAKYFSRQRIRAGHRRPSASQHKSAVVPAANLAA